MQIGLLSLSTLLAIATVAFTLMGLRLARLNVDPQVTTGLPMFALNGVFFVAALACALGSFHLFTKAIG